MKKIPMPWLILLFSAYAHSADYFKCRDPDGGIRYTDRLCSATGSEYIGIKKKQLPVTSDTMERADGKERQANKVLEKKGFSETVAKVSPEIVEAEKTIEPKKSFVQGVFDKIRSFFSPSSKANGDSPSVGNPMATNVETKSAYSCQGKTRCTEMTSCDEAQFYLKNCPNVKIDGDKNGTPCEKQWCK